MSAGKPDYRGVITLAAGSSEIGKLAAGTATIGTVIIERASTKYELWKAFAETAGNTAEQKDMDVFDAFTLYLEANGATNVKVELSPETGDSPTYFELEESPIALTTDDPKLVRVGFHARAIKLTTSGAVTITAIVLGVA